LPVSLTYSANMDTIDIKIIAELQRDGRISNADLADRVGLSPSPCLRRVRLLEERGIISGYRATLDRAKAGFGLTVFVEISVLRHSRENAGEVQDRLAALPGVIACHMVSGAADFLIELVVPDLPAYEKILSEEILTLEAVGDVRSNFSLRQVAVDRPLPLGGR